MSDTEELKAELRAAAAREVELRIQLAGARAAYSEEVDHATGYALALDEIRTLVRAYMYGPSTTPMLATSIKEVLQDKGWSCG